MLEYDPNLPQEFSKITNRNWFTGRSVTLLVAVAFIVGVLVSLSHENRSATQDSVAMHETGKVRALE